MNRSIHTLVLVSAAACGAIAITGAVQRTAEVRAAPESIDDWDKKLGRIKKAAAKEWERVQKWCDRKDVAWTGLYALRQGLTYLPDDEEIREALGYETAPDGRGWMKNDLKTEMLKTATFDVDDPAIADKKFELATKKIVKAFRSSARKAEKNATEDPDNAAAWKERAKQAWQWVLQADRSNEEARKALDHPKVGNRYISPEFKPHLEQRQARKEGGEKTNALAPEVTTIEIGGLMPAAGLSGGAAKSVHLEAHSTHGPEIATSMCLGAEKGLHELVERYGFPEAIKERCPIKTMYSVKDTEQFRQFLMKALRMDKEQATDQERFQGGVSAGPGGRVGVDQGEPDAKDGAMNTFVSYTVRTAGRGIAMANFGAGTLPDVEDWLWQSIGYDCTKRVFGTALTVWAGDPKYGRKFSGRPGEDQWISRARRNVEMDDDPPFRLFPGLKINEQDFEAEHTVKGHAMLQFVFEENPDKARDWVWCALAKGTAEATKEIYELSLDELDERYKRWIIETHY